MSIFKTTTRKLMTISSVFRLRNSIVGIQFANVHDASTFKNLIQASSFKGDNIESLVKE